MMTLFAIAGSLIPGYLVAVFLMMGITFAITSRAPGFVCRDFRIRKRYKLVENFVWLICAVAGGFVTALVASSFHAVQACAVLAIVLICVLWANTWEMRQRGMVNQFLMTLVSVAGVATGYMIQISIKPH